MAEKKLTLLARARKAYETFMGGTGTGRGIIGEIREPLDAISLSSCRISVDSLFTIWRNHGDVNGCVREIKEGTGSAGYRWINKNDESKDPDVKQVNLAEALFNYRRTFRRLKSKIIQHERITGNAYLLLLKGSGETAKPLGFDVIDPRTISVVTDQYGDIVKWIQRVKGEVNYYLPNEILHFKTDDDPNSPVFGFSPLEAVTWEARQDMAAMISNYALIVNDATPGAQYILDEGLSDQEQEQVFKNLQEQLKGAENGNKSIAVKGIKDIKTFRMSAKDMDFMNMRKFTTEKVCATYGVPKSILGYTDDVNLANGEEQTKKLWDGTIAPYQEGFAEFINNQVLPAIGATDIKIEFNSRPFENREWDEASTRADLEHGILTINEVRESRGYETYDPAVYGEWVDKPLLWNGGAVRPLEDLGIELDANGVPTIMNADQAVKEIEKINEMKKRNNRYGTSGKTTKDSG